MKNVYIQQESLFNSHQSHNICSISNHTSNQTQSLKRTTAPLRPNPRWPHNSRAPTSFLNRRGHQFLAVNIWAWPTRSQHFNTATLALIYLTDRCMTVTKWNDLQPSMYSKFPPTQLLPTNFLQILSASSKSNNFQFRLLNQDSSPW
jgi:hypothetical protein